MVNFDAVAAVGLGAVERLVGGVHEVIQRVAEAEAGDTRADGDGGVFEDMAPGNHGPQVLGHVRGMLERGVRREDEEFLAAPAAERVGADSYSAWSA